VIYPFPGKGRRDGGGSAGAAPGDGAATDISAQLLIELPRLRRYAIALVGNRTMAEDLVQDCAERALRYGGSLKDRARIFGWLRTILYNLYMGALREQRSRGTTVDLDDTANSLALSLPPDERTDAVDFVRAMNDLRIEHREILLLVGLEGLSYREVAATLDIPIGTVMSRLARARIQLRSRLDLMNGQAPSSDNHSVETAEDR
jgi:RNA polymerase sigma-70 factor (ECF subfamily)